MEQYGFPMERHAEVLSVRAKGEEGAKMLINQGFPLF
jgi:hypothetical protein